MTTFRRTVRLFILILSVLAGIVAVFAAYIARMMISPPRKGLWATPADLGMPYEEVQFPARDGLRLSGWFIPAKQSGENQVKATLVMVHGWPWNRLGTTAENILTDLPGSSPLQLIHLAHALHRSGYQLLMFDLRNHGKSAPAMPVTFGLHEANDLLGALDYLAGRQEVDNQRIGVVGFSMGANTVLYALPRTDLIKAAVLVQPTSASVFSNRYATSLLGPFGRLIVLFAELIYQVAGGLRLSALDPVFTAAGAGPTPILYVQGIGDPWGSVDNVVQMAAATPNASEPVLVESVGRFGGFQYVIDNPEVVDAFFQEQIDHRS